jgi:hypothetical protein
MTNQDQPEITPEELVRQRQKAAKESSKFWAEASAEMVQRNTDKTLFDHRHD